MTKSNKEFDFWLVQEILLVIFPSDLTLTHLINFELHDNKYLWWTDVSSWYLRVQNYLNYFDNFLYFEESEVEKINEFIKSYISRKKEISYLETIVSSYLYSFNANQYPHLILVSLCICLEATTDQRTELTYRIRRNCSIICGRNKRQSLNIFNSVNEINKMRSAIVHGAKYDSSKLFKYNNYTRNLVSRLIIELTSHNIKKTVDLNEKTTSLGFGQRDLISESYKEFLMNPTPMTEIYLNIKYQK